MNFHYKVSLTYVITPRLHDKKSCVKKPRASHSDFLTLFIKKLKAKPSLPNCSDSAVYDIRSCMQASTCTSSSFSASASLSLCTFKSKTAGWPGIHAGRCGHFIPHCCLPCRPHNLRVQANCKKSDMPHLF